MTAIRDITERKQAERVLHKQVTAWGMRDSAAENGLQALGLLCSAKMRGGPYDLAILDMNMPMMDGYEATKEIRHRELGAVRRTSVIAMTANVMQGDREKALAAGMDGYVSKPVNPTELDEVLERWTADKPGEASAPAGSSGNGHADAPLDPEVLSSLRELGEEGEPDLLAELVEFFVDDTVPRLAGLRKAVKRGDAREVEQLAHTLKGSAGNMGAHRMSHVAGDLQEPAPRKTSPKPKPCWPA